MHFLISSHDSGWKVERPTCADTEYTKESKKKKQKERERDRNQVKPVLACSLFISSSIWPKPTAYSVRVWGGLSVIEYCPVC